MELMSPGTIVAWAVIVDALLGDPRSRWHPVVLIGSSIRQIEEFLFELKKNTRGGGIILIIMLTVFWVGGWILTNALLNHIFPIISQLFQIFSAAFLLSNRSLIEHGHAIARATRSGNIQQARVLSSRLVGRDTEPMGLDDCNRAAVESLSENLTDGVVAPLFFLTLGGVPGLLFFKIVSTLDSMVGYKNDRYIDFGRASAKLDDALNYLPARLTWLLISGISYIIKGLDPKKAYHAGLKYHSMLPSPNSGWSEAAAAGALNIKLAGPIYKEGRMVNDLWIGFPESSTSCSWLQVFKMEQIIAGIVILWTITSTILL